MPIIETMRVIVKEGGHPALINADDFDPAKFEMIEDVVAPAPSASMSSSFVDVDEPEEDEAPKAKRGRK